MYIGHRKKFLKPTFWALDFLFALTKVLTLETSVLETLDGV